MQTYVKTLIGILFGIMLAIIFIKQENMTIRQSFLKTFYPALMSVTGLFSGKKNILQNPSLKQQPPQSFYNLSFVSNANKVVEMSCFSGKYVLLVNTASDCGFTAQLEELQQLQNDYADRLIVIGFPSNDFKQQETLNDNQIEAFCKMNFGVDFLLAKKSVVVKGPQQNPVFQWLSDKSKNGWNQQDPAWNFSKFLVNDQGILVNYFASAVSPISMQVKSRLQSPYTFMSN